MQRAKTHCPHGHPYSGDNLYLSPDGHRFCKACRVRHRRDHAPEPKRRPVEPFQRAFRESGMTRYQLAHALGWYRKATPSMRRHHPGVAERVPDERRVARVLGLVPYRDGTAGVTRIRQSVNSATAEALLAVLPVDPVDVDL